ncbi:unnamed protein product, partial [Rotaria magnacalcarata]
MKIKPTLLKTIYDATSSSEKKPTIVSLDFMKCESNYKAARLFHPIIDEEGFLVIKHIPNPKISDNEELVVIDTNNSEKLVV